MSNLDPALLDRAIGALVGLAAGDALGAGYEFGPAFTEQPRMKGGGLGWAPGEWTDDTQLAICIAEVTATGSCDPAAIGEQLLDWLRGGPVDVGIQTRQVLSSVMTGAELQGAAAEHFARNPHGAAGNGSLMRTAPIALAHLGDDVAIVDAAMAVSALTHGDPLAGEACAIWCIGIDRAVREQRLDGVRNGIALLPADRRAFWTDALDAAETEVPETFSPNGFVVTALQAAWAAITQTSIPDDMPCLHLQRALERAVQIGHDTDTVAAIAGQLLGARWGASAVPLAWREVLHGWPGYRVRDLVRLAALTVRRSESDRDGWPAVSSMLDRYAGMGASGTTVPLTDDPGVRLGDSRSVTDAASDDVVVSLCRLGVDDVPAGVEHHAIWLMDDPRPEHNPNLDFILRDTAEAMVRWRQEGRPVLLHCAMGESRTPTIAAAYLCARDGISAEEALARIAPTLRRSRPNEGFRRALARLWP